MRLSERGAIRSAIADGGFHLYPAGRLLELIQAAFPGDGLRGDFDPAATAEKVGRVQGPSDPQAAAIFARDRELLLQRLLAIPPEYDIEAVFDRMMEAVPAMARRYYGIEGFAAPRPRVLEYYFEGMNDLYRDGDWFAFNVSKAESAELSVPVGTYFKRDQVAPGHPEFVALHEANHAMQELTALPEGRHHYVPWLDEGMADVMARMMLLRATGDEPMMLKLKRFRTEIEISDPRKATYHYGEETAALLLLRGRLPFLRALMAARRRDPEGIDWNALAVMLREGIDPHVAAVKSCRHLPSAAWLKRLERDEVRFRSQGDLDATDLRSLTLFLATERPACLPAGEYAAALWLAARTEVREAEVPEELREGAAALAAKYFVIKKEVAGEKVYDPAGGGLPYRLGCGELRCAY